MKNKYKKVYSLAHKAGYRNYTVKDLIDLKGKKKLTQINVVSPEAVSYTHLTLPTNVAV